MIKIMDIIITNRGILINISEFVKLFTNARLLKLKKFYTIKNKNKITNTYIQTPIASISKLDNVNYLELPRFVLLALFKKNMINVIHNKLEEGLDIQLKYTGKSTHNQLIVVEYLFNKLFPSQAQFGFNGAILNLIAGSGKTFCAMDIIARVNKKTLIVVPNTYLLEQWMELLTQYFPNNKIGCLYGKKKLDGDIIVTIINTAASITTFENKKDSYDFDYDIMRKVGLVIFDEIHLFVSKEYKKIYKRLYSKITIGLSATPTREDNLHRIAELNVGPIINAEELDGYQKNNVKFTSTVNLIKYRCKPENAIYRLREDGILDYQHLLEQILNDPDRNDLIISKIFEMIQNKESHVFIFSERRAHLELLYELLQDKVSESEISLNIELPEMNKSIILYGGVKNDTIDKAKQVSNVIFTSYAFSSVGVSITKMTGLILCTPRKKIESFTQIVGRIFRLSDEAQNAKHRYIYDIIDYKLPIKNGYRERMKVYKLRDSEIISEDAYAS